MLGFLGSGSPKPFASYVTAFLRGLEEAGYVDGRTVSIEYRWAEGRYDRLPALADELVRKPVDIIATVGGNVSAIAAKNATSTIPIVFATADDPVSTGLVSSLSRPAGNLTGLTWLGGGLGAKGLEFLHELMPSVSVIGVMINPKHPNVDVQTKIASEAAASLGKTVRFVNASTDREIEAAYAALVNEKIGAVILTTDPIFNNQRQQIIALEAYHLLPTVYFLREFVVEGGLMSYGASLKDAFHRSGTYAGRILKGAKPGDLPIEQSTKVELVINLKTAKALGVNFPFTLLGRADEVIE